MDYDADEVDDADSTLDEAIQVSDEMSVGTLEEPLEGDVKLGYFALFKVSGYCF